MPQSANAANKGSVHPNGQPSPATPTVTLISLACRDLEAASTLYQHDDFQPDDPDERAAYDAWKFTHATGEPYTPESITDLLQQWRDQATRQSEADTYERAAHLIANYHPPRSPRPAQQRVLQLLREAGYTPPATPRFRLMSIPELMTRPEPKWRVKGVIQDGTSSVLAAPHASFKTLLVLDLSLSIATGREWAGREVRQGEVVYICAEGASGMRSRILAWCHDREEEMPAAFHFIEEAVQIHSEDELSALIAAIGDTQPALIVFDTLSLCALGLDENSNRDMNLVMHDLKRLQDATGAHVMLVHHSSKTGGIRGASSIPAAVHTEFEMKRDRDAVTLTNIKQKDAREFAPMTFTSRDVEYDTFYAKSSLVLDYEGEGQNPDSMRGSDRQVYELLVSYFGQQGASSSKWQEVAKEHGISAATFYRAKKNLVDLKKVDDGKEGRGGHGATYRPIEPTDSTIKPLKDLS